MKRDDLLTKLIKRFYGVRGDWEPQQEQKINRLGVRVFVGYWLYLMISIVVAVICLLLNYQQAANMFVVATATVTLVVIPYILLSKVKRGSIKGYVEVSRSELKHARHSALVGALCDGLFYMALLYAMGAVLDLHDHTFRDSLFDTNRLFGCLIAGAVYTFFMALFAYFNVNPKKENKS